MELYSGSEEQAHKQKSPQGGVVIRLFLGLWVWFAELPNRAMLEQSVCGPEEPLEEGPGKNLPFSVWNKWWILAMRTDLDLQYLSL